MPKKYHAKSSKPNLGYSTESPFKSEIPLSIEPKMAFFALYSTESKKIKPISLSIEKIVNRLAELNML